MEAIPPVEVITSPTQGFNPGQLKRLCQEILYDYAKGIRDGQLSGHKTKVHDVVCIVSVYRTIVEDKLNDTFRPLRELPTETLRHMLDSALLRRAAAAPIPIAEGNGNGNGNGSH